MKFNHLKLQGRIRELGLTHRDVASAIGLTAATFSIKMNGKSAFTQDEIRKMCDLLGIDKHEIGSYFFTLQV
jgi:cyanate lyase